MPRRMKTPAAPAITSLPELVERLGRYAALSARAETLAAKATEELAAIKARLEAEAAPLAAEMKAILLAAKPWWAANSEQLTEGKRKSVELAGCLIGERLSKPALGHPKPEHVAIELLRGHGLAAMIRVKEEMDKLAISRLLAFTPPRDGTTPDDNQLIDELEAMELRDTLERLGFSIIQKEEFFIARAGDVPEATETVADPTEQVPA